MALLLLLAWLWTRPLGSERGDLTSDGRMTLTIFALAVCAWAFTSVDDTYIALGAGTSLVLLGVMQTEDFFATLGDDVVWLLVAACVMAVAITASGLAQRVAGWLVCGASTPRQLVHLVTATLVVTAFAIPSTSGRAALALPIFVALARALAEHRSLVKVLALVFPTVILLSAVGSLIGAGAHLVTSMLVQTATGTGFSFTRWLLLGLPLALVSAHLAAELVLRLFSARADRKVRLRLSITDLEDRPGQLTGSLTVGESRAALLLAVTVTLWCTEDLHGIHPAIVALGGALVATSPRYGVVKLKKALPEVPWSLLLFMAATLALGNALLNSGAAYYIAENAFKSGWFDSPVPFMVMVVVISTAAHLLVQSRSARSAVLIPIVIALAPGAGVSIAAAAFASTAAAGFCHTLPSSAKPVALFSEVKGLPTYTPADLRRLSFWLAPMSAALVLIFSFFVWPLLGLPVS
ncbi:SLC13 family permease [Demetria terragena]|uniref:SLC13 family permease n=1 Tax=Demetria terragena TaxID=63959 RepID=UPI00036977CC|nr:SLC13 family permease [Demetria terragena]